MIKTVEKSDILQQDLRGKISVLEIENRHLKEQLEWLKRQVFGQKSERFIDPVTEDELLPGLNLAAPLPDNTDEIIVPVHRRKKNKGGKQEGHRRRHDHRAHLGNDRPE